MLLMDEGSRFLADELERLVQLPLASKAQVNQWYSEARKVQDALSRSHFFDFPHHIWHYFSDADIRARDPDYKRSQDEAITDYIRKVRSSPGAT
jgi:hypothetical protein